MKIVLDTNLLLVCISRKSDLNWIFQKLIDEEYDICVTTEILSEYAEILSSHMGIEVADNVLKTIMNLPNLHRINVYYKWNLIKDVDDNKFVDCAVASNAKFLVTEDKHFKILKKIDFPKVKVISAEQFKNELEIQSKSD